MNIQNQEIEEIIASLGHLNDKFKNQTIAVFGCGGFLGHLFTKYFLAVGAKVVGMDNFIIGVPKVDIDNPNFTFFNHDLCQDVSDKLKDFDIDYIMNCAGIADPKVYSKFPINCMDISYIGTKNILYFASKSRVKSTFLFSSSEIYGNPDPKFIPTPEEYNGDCPSVGERACYDQFKRGLETVGDVYSRIYGVNVKVVRPFNTYSSYMSLKDNRVLPSFMRNILENKPIQLYKPSDETRTFCYATDFINGCIRVLLSEQSKFEIYNCGNDTPEISMADLAKLVVDVAKTNTPIELVEPPAVYKIQPKRRCPDITKLRKLGYEPKVSLEKGIERYYNWAKENYKT